MSRQRIIALLGKADAPTDAVEEYCRYLGEAMQEQGFDLLLERVRWDENGWAAARRSLRRHAKGWRGTWVLVQYTALAWSRRGFPMRFPHILRILKFAGVRLGVVFHDVEPFHGTRVIDRVRQRSQAGVMRKALKLADAAIFTVPMERLSWIKLPQSNAVFVPVGANFPTASEAVSRKGIATDEKLGVAVFSVTGGKAGEKELEEIVGAVRFAAAQVKGLRLIVLGRNSKAAEAELRRRLSDTSVELHVMGVLPGEDVVRSLALSDVLLFVRGHISTRRSSAIAGIACGLPVIAFEGPETAFPITEAGVAVYSPTRKGDLGEVLLRVLQDQHYRASLAQRSWVAQQQYFSWTAIAEKYAAFLKSGK
ncbi:MAG TPA: glycosyltransferase [Candidatus Angelobacter sp.]|nr:glycosyltransferase [Candidatus Angelobacter sp.]